MSWTAVPPGDGTENVSKPFASYHIISLSVPYVAALAAVKYKEYPVMGLSDNQG